MLHAIHRLIRECEENPLAAPNVDAVTDARIELDAHLRQALLLRRLRVKPTGSDRRRT